MLLKDVKAGELYTLTEPYCDHGERYEAILVEHLGSSRPEVVLKDKRGREETISSGRGLMPWREFQVLSRVREGERREIRRITKRLTRGRGEVHVVPCNGKTHWLQLDALAAESLITSLGGRPLPDDCLPSLADPKDYPEVEARSLRMARKVRRALGAGRVSDWCIGGVKHTDYHCQLEITLPEAYEIEERLLGKQSALSDLLSS